MTPDVHTGIIDIESHQPVEKLAAKAAERTAD
jgi:hypothetical protein